MGLLQITQILLDIRYFTLRVFVIESRVKYLFYMDVCVHVCVCVCSHILYNRTSESEYLFTFC
jgi:hypothetical protein